MRTRLKELKDGRLREFTASWDIYQVKNNKYNRMDDLVRFRNICYEKDFLTDHIFPHMNFKLMKNLKNHGGNKVIFVGTVSEYERTDGTFDYNIQVKFTRRAK